MGWMMDQDNNKKGDIQQQGQWGRDKGWRGKDNDSHQHPTTMSSCSQGGNNWHGKDREDATMKKKGSHDNKNNGTEQH